MLQQMQQQEIIGLRMQGLVSNARKPSVTRDRTNRFRGALDSWRNWKERSASSDWMMI